MQIPVQTAVFVRSRAPTLTPALSQECLNRCRELLATPLCLLTARLQGEVERQTRQHSCTHAHSIPFLLLCRYSAKVLSGTKPTQSQNASLGSLCSLGLQTCLSRSRRAGVQPTDSVCRRPAQEAALCAGTCELGSVRITCVNRCTARTEHSAANDRGLRGSG